VTGLRGRTRIAGAALIVLAGLLIPAVAVMTSVTAGVTASAIGVDVGAVQPPTWTQVQAAGNSFVGIKATEGNYFQNKYYVPAVTAAVAAGLYVMPYVFANPYNSTAKGNGTAVQQADYAWNNKISKVAAPAYRSSAQMLPVVLDIEPDPYTQREHTNQCYGLSPAAMVEWIGQFLTEIQRDTGKTPIIYTTSGWWDLCTGSSTAFGTYPLWIAEYGASNPALPAGWNNYTFWQYTSSGTVPGVNGTVDQDYLGPVTQFSQAGTPIGAVQLRTLSSLNNLTPVTYTVPGAGSAGGLPPGLTMSPSGQITGTPLASDMGQQYTVTVTPSAGAAQESPPSLSFTWDMAGPITLFSPGARRTPAGSPVVLRISASDPDKGYVPSFTAAGLPAGLSMDSTGLITGWPSVPGTYHVTVSASDAFGGSGSISFTWTIPAVAGTGFTGQIRQVGGTGKCLNDPSSNTANGTLMTLWSCDGKSNQAWTVVQDGTIRVLGKCLAVSGTRVVLWKCSSGYRNQEWQASTDGELVNALSGKCLYFAAANAPNGGQPTMAACANVTTQSGEHWNRPAASVYSGEPGKCLAAFGSSIVLATCAATAAQHWTAASDGTLRLGSNCLTETGITAGSALSLGPCSGAAATKWQLASAGPIAVALASSESDLCVTAPSPASGTALVSEACAATPAQTWRVG
jgi:GH25 family lysozyme M1 (1,4-beta-N-acetylmuramidase)